MGNMLSMLYVEEIHSCVIWVTSRAYKSFCNIVMGNLKCLYFLWPVHFPIFFAFQMVREPARKGALIPNIRSENLKENSFSVCTLTRRNACNCLGCWTSPTDKWRFGFRIVAWRRRNWTEIDYSIIRPILCFRDPNSTVTAPLVLCCWTHSVYRLTLRLWLSSVHCVPQWPRQQQQHCSMVNFKFEDTSFLWSE